MISSPYWVTDPEKIANIVANVLERKEELKVSENIKVNYKDEASKQNATVAMLNALQNGDGIHIRYDNLPGNTSWHSMSVVGAHIENGNIILNVRDYLVDDEYIKTYINTRTMELYRYNGKTKKRYPIDRNIQYFRITGFEK